MFKRASAFLAALTLLFITVFNCSLFSIKAEAAGGPVIKLHYSRADEEYSDWDVWMWEEGKDGAGYEFEDIEGDMVATMEVTPGTNKVGFIVRTKDWTKDVDKDQFIDISAIVSGTVHIYVESGVEGYTEEPGDDIVVGIKLKSAKYDGKNTINVLMTAPIDRDISSVFTVEGRDGEIEISDIKSEGDGAYTVTLGEELSLFRSYTITFEENKYKVIMPNIYSTPEFESAYTYLGDDLGYTYSKESTSFRVWSPTAESIELKRYESGIQSKDDLIETVPLKPDVNGTWVCTVEGDLNGTYYVYSVSLDGKSFSVMDPYARSSGANGKRSMVLDLSSTDPEGWSNDRNPFEGKKITDAIIYEAHIRDLTVGEDNGIEEQGKFLGMVEENTATSEGIATGLAHIKEMGVTHVHVLPMYDFGSLDETNKSNGVYNWGYDPVNYNIPEGTYSTDPFNGEVRVNEVKQMVKGFHDNGIAVVMDVVYNHVHEADSFCINKLVPGYFSRITEEGTYSNGSGCGNDTATERSMVRKYIVDSVNYWADEYHIDGFRFDLVGLMDTDLINEIVETVHAKHPDTIFYGEGWSLTTVPTKEGVTLATQDNSSLTPGFSYFNDTIRDGIKGSVFNTDPGFVSGASGYEAKIRRCFMGADRWCQSPSQTINYASCHDNNTLYDRLRLSRPDASDTDIVRMNNLSAAIYMLSEGTPFMQAGEEMLRTKTKVDGTYESNSYASGDEVNAIDWSLLSEEKYSDVYEYYKGLISFRKAHPLFRLSDAKEVSSHVTDITGPESNTVSFLLDGSGIEGETAEEICVVFNGANAYREVVLPEGNWNIYITSGKAGIVALEAVTERVVCEPISALVLIKEDASNVGKTPKLAKTSSKSKTAAAVGGILGGAALVGIVEFLTGRKDKKLL
ncbi:MAG: type I pullulanase [Lachnospiraceae bacterium]|nr:type I pullulanase [Lachnospiraceae bacterium]